VTTRRLVAVSAATVTLLAACTRTHAAPQRSASAAAPSITAITAGPVPSPFPVASIGCSAGHPNPVIVHGLFEVKGAATGATLWALVFADHPFVAARQVKIAWHMTGDGPPQMSATNLDTGQRVAPASGPGEHTSSSWHRPGGEWGSTWLFPSPGCWRITMATSTGTGSITVTVTQPPK
jgi:hypothetical protein